MALNIDSAVRVRASVDGLQQIEGLRKGLGGVESQAGRTGGALGRLQSASGAAMNALRVIAPAASIAGMAAMAKNTLDQADALSKMSERTGVAVPILDKFRQAANLTDTSLDAVEKGLTRLANPTTKAVGALDEMGISLVDASGKLRGTDDVMLDIAKRFNEMPNGADKARLATDIFGKSLGTELIPMLNMGRDAIESLQTAFTQSFADRAAAFNDQITTMQQKFGTLAAEITIAMLPALEILASALTKALDAFMSMPKEMQAIVGVLGLLAGAFALLAPVIVPLLGILKSIVAIKFAATLAGWAGAIGPVIGVLGTLGKILLGVFTGPVGWVALAAAAGVAIYAFRDQIAEVFGIIGQMLTELANAFKTTFIDPIIKWNMFLADQFQQIFTQIADAIGNAFQQAIDFVNNTFVQPATEAVQNLYQGILDVFNSLPDALRSPFEAAGNMIRGIVNNILNGIGNAISAVVQAINNVIQGANQALALLDMPQIPYLPMPSIPQFADGGMVSGPTLAMVGEGGEPEYIVPESKAAGFANNWMSGRRGLSAIPGFASGGVVMPSGGASSRGLTAAPRFADGGVVMPANAQVNIQTGPVTQMDGTNFVTTQDMSRAVQSGVQQTLSMLRNNINTRRAVGIA